MNSKARKISNFYGIAHAIGCPSHGLLGLLIKTGILLPATLVTTLKVPHELIENYLVKPPIEYAIKGLPNYEGRAEHIAHVTTDVLGWGAFGGFIVYSSRKYLKNKKDKIRERTD